MSLELQIIIGGYVLLVVIIVGIVGFYVVSYIVSELFRDWDKRQKDAERKRNESRRRKTL